MSKTIKRCAWAGDDPLLIAYHDREWGVPVHEDKKLFEFLILEGAQAGLSWLTVLRKRENYRAAFDGFLPSVIAGYKEKDVQRLLKNEGIIRNRLKIEAAVANARQFLAVQAEFGTFDAYIWSFVNGKVLDHRLTARAGIPATTKESDAMSKDMKKRGFKFVGSTICYAFMQAVGMVNDHRIDCFRHGKV
ncbi:MAG: DNA-3-methyladenine glycosylase [Nitrospirae bacterium GWD2_57_9]|nr:MAG: DNA-3-methyladenine glycosylase [Nitrospirae bacterium GWD2_57_9]